MIWKESHCVSSELMSRNFPEGTKKKKRKYLQAWVFRFQLWISQTRIYSSPAWQRSYITGCGWLYIFIRFLLALHEVNPHTSVCPHVLPSTLWNTLRLHCILEAVSVLNACILQPYRSRIISYFTNIELKFINFLKKKSSLCVEVWYTYHYGLHLFAACFDVNNKRKSVFELCTVMTQACFFLLFLKDVNYITTGPITSSASVINVIERCHY